MTIFESDFNDSRVSITDAFIISTEVWGSSIVRSSHIESTSTMSVDFRPKITSFVCVGIDEHTLPPTTQEWQRFFARLKEQPHLPFVTIVGDFQQLQPIANGTGRLLHQRSPSETSCV